MHSSSSRKAAELSQSSAGPQSTNPFSTSTPTRRPAAPSAGNGPSDADGELPPAYQPPIATGTDDRFAFLRSLDTVFLIDDSGSMAGRSWREVRDALAQFVPIAAAYDADGVDIHFLNHAQSYTQIRDPKRVLSVFDTVSPWGGTPTGRRLLDILSKYVSSLEKPNGLEREKPLNLIVITDGVPSDDPEGTIVQIAKKLDKMEAPTWQIGVQFIQVGNEPEAAEALQDLDDGIASRGNVRDMVDTTPWKPGPGSNGEDILSADGILKALLGGVIGRLDRKRNSSEQLRERRR